MLKDFPSRLPSTVLITRHDKIGDFILALPLCKAIKDQYPEIRVGILVSEVNYELANSFTFIDFVILYGADFLATAREIRRERPDLSISCYIDNRLGALLLFAGIPTRIAPATKIAQVFFNRCLNQRRSRVEKQEWQYNIELASALLPSLSFKPPLVSFPGPQTKHNRVIFHPGSGGSSEGNLRLVDYLRLARKAATIPGLEVVFTFGPNDCLLLEQVQSEIDFPATIIAEPMKLIDFCEFISRSILFVSTSTGPMHLAGSVNTPTLSFFGASLFASNKRWSPINELAYQSNFLIEPDYDSELINRIEGRLIQLLTSPKPTGVR